MSAPRTAGNPEDYTMSFGEHLEELRKRLLYAVCGVAVACFVTFYYFDSIYQWLVSPLIHAQIRAGLAAEVFAPKVTTAFTLYMKVGVIAGLALASPWVLYQLWKFISAGLYASERRIVYILAPFSLIMTFLGVIFFYYILLPLALIFLIGFPTTFALPRTDQPAVIDRAMGALPQWSRSVIDWINGAPPPVTPTTQPTTKPSTDALPSFPEMWEDPVGAAEGQHWLKKPENELRVFLDGRVHVLPIPIPSALRPMIFVDEYFDFVMFMGLGIIFAFQVPVAMLVAGWMGVIAPSTIARYRKHAIFFCIVASAVLTPTGDPFNMTLMAVPLWLLFELGLLVMRISYRKRAENAE